MLLLQCFLRSLPYAYPEHANVPLIVLVQVAFVILMVFVKQSITLFLMSKKNFIEKDYLMQDE